ncbi:hypothetical protein Leryth_022155 [Lithospermum erythrorhizon]|nr:hypothetical protein Leryth_022155 [Lithospermum erythrorhizon]
MRHMISHLKKFEVNMSRMNKVLHICNGRRLMSLFMYVFPKAIPKLRRHVVVKKINL